MTEKYVGCSVRQLPQETLVEAARTAIAENPANAPAISFLLPGGLFAPQHLAMLTSKWWGNGGVKLTVSFLDNPDQATRRLILEHANAWSTRANVSFVETAQGGQVRIARAGDGYWSYLGTDVLHIGANKPTMNLEGFTANTPLSEYKRVVKHEFGHTLGWPHEHMRKEIVARIDPQKAINYFARTQGWNAQMVREQVLTPLLDSEITALASDVVSIMCYQLPGEITVDGQPIPGGLDIDEEDFALAAKLYPKTSTPTPTPTPTPQREFGFRLVGAFGGGLLRISGVPPLRAGEYDVVHSGQAAGEARVADAEAT
jgi:hypothetical protein